MEVSTTRRVPLSTNDNPTRYRGLGQGAKKTDSVRFYNLGHSSPSFLRLAKGEMDQHQALQACQHRAAAPLLRRSAICPFRSCTATSDRYLL